MAGRGWTRRRHVREAPREGSERRTEQDELRQPGQWSRDRRSRRSPPRGRLRRLRAQSSALEGEAQFPPLVRQWARPTLGVHGLIGGFTGEGEKTVIPSRGMAKVSVRLVPDQDHEEIVRSLEKYGARALNAGCEDRGAPAGRDPACTHQSGSRWAAAAMEAFEAAFGRKARLVRSGGSIPVAIDLQEALKAPMIVSGLPEADSAPHSPNERYSLDQLSPRDRDADSIHVPSSVPQERLSARSCLLPAPDLRRTRCIESR